MELDKRIDGVMDRLAGMLDDWLNAFEQRPVATTLKIVLALYVLRFVRRTFR